MTITAYIILGLTGVLAILGIYVNILKNKNRKLADTISEKNIRIAIIERQRDLLKENLVQLATYVEKDQEIKKRTDKVLQTLNDEGVTDEEKDKAIVDQYNAFVSNRKLSN